MSPSSTRSTAICCVCETLSKINLAAFFFGEWRPILAETVRWLARALPLILRDWPLLRRMMRGDHEHEKVL